MNARSDVEGHKRTQQAGAVAVLRTNRARIEATSAVPELVVEARVGTVAPRRS